LLRVTPNSTIKGSWLTVLIHLICHSKLMACDLEVCTILPSLCAKNYYHNYYATTPWCLAFHVLSMSPVNWGLTNLDETLKVLKLKLDETGKINFNENHKERI
jgi:hypothetical protein